MNIVLSFSALSILLLIGKFLRVKVRIFQKLYLPSSVIAGIIGLSVIQIAGSQTTSSFTAGWDKLPGFLINIVFASLFMGMTIPPLKTIWKKAGPQLAYGQIVAWGQYIVGLGLSIFLLAPLFGTPDFLGVIVPVGFEGGHGTAGGLKPTFEYFKWQDGTDFALASATAGIISAIIVGIALINWAVRKGITKKLKSIEEIPESNITGIYEPDRRPLIGYQTVAPESLDTLAFHIAVIGLAVFIGYGIKYGLIQIQHLFPSLEKQKFFNGFPLFPLAMLGGLIVQILFSKFSKHNPIDRGLMQRISGTALDFLVVSAISTIRLSVIVKGIVPFLILVAGGILWNVVCVMWVAKKLLPDAWFERAIAEMGQSMGVTATGLLLLRVVDPESETDAYSAFGYKQLLHEPFMGGGLWTSTAIPLAITHGAGVVFTVSLIAVALWTILWILMFRKQVKTSPS